MGAEDGIFKKSKDSNKIQVFRADNLHVVAIKNLMNETGMNYHDAGEMYKAGAERSPELLEQISKAVQSIKLQLDKSKHS